VVDRRVRRRRLAPRAVRGLVVADRALGATQGRAAVVLVLIRVRVEVRVRGRVRVSLSEK